MGGSYKAYGTDMGDEVQVSAGARWGFAERATLDVGYRGKYTLSNGINSNGANIGLNYSF